jgi:hypothetical protein
MRIHSISKQLAEGLYGRFGRIESDTAIIAEWVERD